MHLTSEWVYKTRASLKKKKKKKKFKNKRKEKWERETMASLWRKVPSIYLEPTIERAKPGLVFGTKAKWEGEVTQQVFIQVNAKGLQQKWHNLTETSAFFHVQQDQQSIKRSFIPLRI